MKRYNCVIVEWNDASHFSESYHLDEIRKMKPLKVATIGFLVKNGKKEIAVSHELNQDNRLRNTTLIPRAYITKIVNLTENGGNIHENTILAKEKE